MFAFKLRVNCSWASTIFLLIPYLFVIDYMDSSYALSIPHKQLVNHRMLTG